MKKTTKQGLLLLVFLFTVGGFIISQNTHSMLDEHEHIELAYIQFYTFTYCPTTNKVLKDGVYVEPRRIERQRIDAFKTLNK